MRLFSFLLNNQRPHLSDSEEFGKRPEKSKCDDPDTFDVVPTSRTFLENFVWESVEG